MIDGSVVVGLPWTAIDAWRDEDGYPNVLVLAMSIDKRDLITDGGALVNDLIDHWVPIVAYTQHGPGPKPVLGRAVGVREVPLESVRSHACGGRVSNPVASVSRSMLPGEARTSPPTAA